MNMLNLAIITLLASCVTFVAASPMPSQAEIYATATATSSGAEPTFTVAKRRRTFNCNQDDRLKRIEAQAWADAGAMAEIADKYDSGNEWQPAMNYWMGADSTKSENFWKIAAALKNERNIHHPNWVFPEAVVDIYCGDTHPTEKKVCRERQNPRDPKGPNVTQFASSWTERGNFYNTYNVLLCPRFFNEKSSLESILHDMDLGKKKASNASEYKFSWGHTIYHELMHLDPVIANEEVWDVAYGACPVAKLANQNGCNYSPVLWHPPGWNSKHGEPHSMINADSWAFFASGVYFQKAAKLKEPGRAPNDCGIYSGENLANFTYTGSDYDPEGILLPTVNRTDGTFDAKVPPDPAPENTPPDDPPTPSLPYVRSNLPSGLATPFNAEAYFATYTPAVVSIPSALPPISTKAPPPISTSSALPPATTTAGPDLKSQVCVDCTNALGASNCGASDQQCLTKQCKSDKNCQACKINCSTVGSG